jgi:hypothetical protein
VCHSWEAHKTSAGAFKQNDKDFIEIVLCNIDLTDDTRFAGNIIIAVSKTSSTGVNFVVSVLATASVNSIIPTAVSARNIPTAMSARNNTIVLTSVSASRTSSAVSSDNQCIIAAAVSAVSRNIIIARNSNWHHLREHSIGSGKKQEHHDK